MKPVRLEILGVAPPSGTNVMVLRETDGNRALVMGIGAAEAMAIAAGAVKAKLPRPLTHDLIKELLDRLEAPVRSVIIHDVRDSAFIASLEIESSRGVLEVDCRPSDAVALALRCRAPVYVDEAVLERAGVDVASLLQPKETKDEEENADGPEWIE